MKITLVVIVVLILVGGGVALGYWLQGQHVFETDTRTRQATPTPSASPSASTTPTGTPSAVACSSQNLKVAVAPEVGGGTAGSVYYAVSLTNNGSHPCTVVGYPGVSLVNAAGQQVGQPADRSETDKPSTVVLQAGQKASATLRVVQNNFDPGVCKDGATGLKVFPPNLTVSLTVPTSIATWCPGFTVGAMRLP